jgi:hypothetical protein
MAAPSDLMNLIQKLRDIEARLVDLEDRCVVVENATIDHESRLQEIEELEDGRDD